MQKLLHLVPRLGCAGPNRDKGLETQSVYICSANMYGIMDPEPYYLKFTWTLLICKILSTCVEEAQTEPMVRNSTLPMSSVTILGGD